MQTLRIVQRTGKDGVLSLRLPLGQAEAEYEVVIVAQLQGSGPPPSGWPADYWSLAGSIEDETFVRPPQGELPAPVQFE